MSESKKPKQTPLPQFLGPKPDARHAAKIYLVIGGFFFLLAFTELLLGPGSMAEGRWGWAYVMATKSLGPYGWVIVKSLLGTAFIWLGLVSTYRK